MSLRFQCDCCYSLNAFNALEIIQKAVGYGYQHEYQLCEECAVEILNHFDKMIADKTTKRKNKNFGIMKGVKGEV